MSYHMIPKGRILIGTAGMTADQKAAGYTATICTEVIEAHPSGKVHNFIDIHVTKTQLEGLKEQIEALLPFLHEPSTNLFLG
jgi:hypothetical protein